MSCRNTNYNGKYAATADKMHWDILLDDTSRTTALQEATVQVMENVPDANAEQLMAAGASVDYIQGFNQPFFMFNTLKKPFDDKRVRQAFYYAVDVGQADLQRHGRPCREGDELPAREPRELPQGFHGVHLRPREAKSLLSEAGVTDLSFELMTNNNWVKNLPPASERPRCHRRELHHQRDEDRLGVSGRVGRRAALRRHADPGRPDLLRQRPRPADVLVVRRQRGGPRGRSCWKKAGDGKFDELQTLMQQAREATGNEQQELWNKCFDLLAEEVPLYPLFHRELATGYQETQITGFEPIATTGLVFLGASVKA